MQEEKQRLINSLLYPVIFLIVIWLVKIIEVSLQADLYFLGIYPKTLGGLKGILLSPFIHGDFRHLISNSMPILVLGAALFYFYRTVAIRVFIYSMLITGLWVWVIARPSFHIGASGIIYSLAAFLFTSGVIRKHPRLMALSLLVVFIYGGMVWGIFPIKERVSWESHLMGMACGVMLAFFFREHGPQRKMYSWDYEEEMLPDEEEMLADEEEMLADEEETLREEATEEGASGEGTRDKGLRGKDDDDEREGEGGGEGYSSHTGNGALTIKYRSNRWL